MLEALPRGSEVTVAPHATPATASVARVTVRAPLPAPAAIRSLLGDHRVAATVTTPDERAE